MDLIIIVSISFVLEFLEAFFFMKANTLKNVLKYQYSIYKYSLFIYILGNFTLFYMIFVSLYMNNFSIYMNIAIILKFVDISFKLYLFSKIDRESFDSLNLLLPIDMEITPLIRYMNLTIYPPLLFCAILN
jgi:hypothetical protein